VDERKARAIVRRHWRRIGRSLGLEGWEIRLFFGQPEQADQVASCDADPSYQVATITLDPARAESEEDLLDSLLHELAHVVHAPFELFWRLALVDVPDGPRREQLKELWLHCCEQTRLIVQRGYLMRDMNRERRK
jgi:hypothetical protein